MNRDEARARIRAMASEFNARGDATGWFEHLYSSARGDASHVPWSDGEMHPLLVEWLDLTKTRGEGRRALVIGCGLGEDAEGLAHTGFDVTAFDISKSAIDWCKTRYPNTRVHYVVADALAPPAGWRARFDFVLESYTLQALPTEVRARAMPKIAELVAPNGTLLVIARARDDGEPLSEVPWPLSRAELAVFERAGLVRARLDDRFDAEDPPVRRFRAEYRAPAAR
jgi:SAM-dependent methyltransferase